MRKFIIDLLTKDIGGKFISLALAIIIWMVVVAIDDPMVTRTYSQIQVELVNTEAVTAKKQVYEVVNGTDYVNVTVTAQRSVIDALSRDNFKATADFSEMSGNEIDIDVKATRFADRIEEIGIKGQDKLQLMVQDIVDKQFTISGECTGTAMDGYMAGGVTVNDNVVKVKGPENEIEKIARAVVYVDISNITSNISTTEDIRLVDDHGNQIRSDFITLNKSEAAVEVEMWKMSSIPIGFAYSGTAAEGYGVNGDESVSPAFVTVAGAIDTIDSIRSIEIPETAVSIEGASSDVSVQVPIEDYLPEGIVLSSGDEGTIAMVHVGISELEEKIIEVPVANIKAINVPEGMQATIGGLGDVVAIHVKGLGSVYEQLTPELITGIVDVSLLRAEDGSIGADIYDVPVEFVFPEGIYGGDNSVTAQLVLQDAGIAE